MLFTLLSLLAGSAFLASTWDASSDDRSSDDSSASSGEDGTTSGADSTSGTDDVILPSEGEDTPDDAIDDATVDLGSSTPEPEPPETGATLTPSVDGGWQLELGADETGHVVGILGDESTPFSWGSGYGSTHSYGLTLYLVPEGVDVLSEFDRSEMEEELVARLGLTELGHFDLGSEQQGLNADETEATGDSRTLPPVIGGNTQVTLLKAMSQSGAPMVSMTALDGYEDIFPDLGFHTPTPDANPDANADPHPDPHPDPNPDTDLPDDPDDPEDPTDPEAPLVETYPDAQTVITTLPEGETRMLILVNYTDTEDAGIGLAVFTEQHLYLAPAGTVLPDESDPGYFDGEPGLPLGATLADLETLYDLTPVHVQDTGHLIPIGYDPEEDHPIWEDTQTGPWEFGANAPIHVYDIEANADGDDLLTIDYLRTIGAIDSAPPSFFTLTEGEDDAPVTNWDGTIGTGDGDVLVASDTTESFVSALGGDDIIRADGIPYVLGGAGDDVILVDDAALVRGGSGDDVIDATASTRIEGGSGDDLITYSGTQPDTGEGTILDAGEGDDTIVVDTASTGARVFTGPGADVVTVGLNQSVIDMASGGADEDYADLQYMMSGDNTVDHVTVEVMDLDQARDATDRDLLLGGEDVLHYAFDDDLAGGTLLVIDHTLTHQFTWITPVSSFGTVITQTQKILYVPAGTGFDTDVLEDTSLYELERTYGAVELDSLRVGAFEQVTEDGSYRESDTRDMFPTPTVTSNVVTISGIVLADSYAVSE